MPSREKKNAPQHKQESFKDLQENWYKKLKDSGFTDIEDKMENLKQWDSSYFQLRYDPESYRSKETYFYRARQFLGIYPFPTPIHHEVWRLHSEGLGVRRITTLIGESLYLDLPLFKANSKGSSNKDGVLKLLTPIEEAFMQWLRNMGSDE